VVLHERNQVPKSRAKGDEKAGERGERKMPPSKAQLRDREWLRNLIRFFERFR